jgi:hypothetical protein
MVSSEPCVEQGPWQAAQCHHGSCSVDGACSCQAGYRDDNLWFGGSARCLLPARAVEALLALNFVVCAVMLAQLVRVCKFGSGRATPQQRNVRLALASNMATMVFLTLNAVHGVFQTASQIPLVIAMAIAEHANINSLSVLLSAVAACSDNSNAVSRLLRCKRECQYAVRAIYVITVLAVSSLVSISQELDDAQAARAQSSAWWVFVVFSLALAIPMCFLAYRLSEAKNALVELVSQFCVSVSSAQERRLRALKNRTIVTFWITVSANTLYTFITTAFIAVQLLVGFMPFTSVAIHLATLILPLSLIHVGIEASTNVTLWSSVSSSTFVRKLITMRSSASHSVLAAADRAS